MDAAIQQKVSTWLEGNFDEDVKQQVKALQSSNTEELADAFYRNLEFGTGGLRGLMGVGTNRMNKYTVGMATQGYANYLKKSFPGNQVEVAIAYDSRNNSRFFAETAAHVCAANEIEVFLFGDMRPTRRSSFSSRPRGCKGGVICSGSHNTQGYNSYTGYSDHGSQLGPPHAVNVIKGVDRMSAVEEVRCSAGHENIKPRGEQP